MSDLDELTGVLGAWQEGIARHEPDRVGAVFTEDAIFQGLRPYSVGRAGVVSYYGGQPAGMTVGYRVHEVRRLAADVLLGWVAADFTFTDGRPAVEVNLTVVLTGGLISHYHVSRR
jgi:hypothetical protein